MDPKLPTTGTKAPTTDKRDRVRRGAAVIIMYEEWQFQPQYPAAEQSRVRKITNQLKEWARGGFRPLAAPSFSRDDLHYLREVFPRLYQLGAQPRSRLNQWLNMHPDRIRNWNLGDFLNTRKEDQQRGIIPRHQGCPDEVVEAWRTHPENPSNQVGPTQAPAQGAQATQPAPAAQQPWQTHTTQQGYALPFAPAGPPFHNGGQLNPTAPSPSQHNLGDLLPSTGTLPSPHHGFFDGLQQQQRQRLLPQQVPLPQQQNSTSAGPSFNPAYGQDIATVPQLPLVPDYPPGYTPSNQSYNNYGGGAAPHQFNSQLYSGHITNPLAVLPATYQDGDENLRVDGGYIAEGNSANSDNNANSHTNPTESFAPSGSQYPPVPSPSPYNYYYCPPISPAQPPFFEQQQQQQDYVPLFL